MKVKRLEYMRNAEDDGGWIPRGCVACGGELRFNVPVYVERPLICPDCGQENAVTLEKEFQFALVRLPWGCQEWVRVESSNLAAAGAAGEDLLVSFRAGATYVYPGAADLLHALAASESKGRFFHAKIRPRTCARLCDAYGCPERVTSSDPVCSAHRG